MNALKGWLHGHTKLFYYSLKIVIDQLFLFLIQ